MSLGVNAIPTVVVSDFGRDAALRFCTELARRERGVIGKDLPASARFYDEYRRMALRVVGELPFIKAPWLAGYHEDRRLFDDRVLVGFPGGPPVEEIVARVAVLVVESLAGPAARGCGRAIVALPCNTLAPVSWALRDAFRSRSTLGAMLDEAGGAPPGFDVVARRLAGTRVAFPTVPEAVLARCEREGDQVILPLGTPGIARVYERAAVERGVPVSVATLNPADHGTVMEAIQASIAADARRRDESAQALIGLRDEALERFGAATTVVEACTDLDYGVGLDSVGCYADAAVSLVYGDG